MKTPDRFPEAPQDLFLPQDPRIKSLLDTLVSVIDTVFPLPRRFHNTLPKDVAELSRFFTSNRQERGLSYLGKPNLLSAYLRYFLPWNVYRLCKFLPSLPLELKEGDIVFDLGSGPLTLVLALWISRPDLRSLPVEFICLDRTSLVLEAGKKIFAALAQNPQQNTVKVPCPWRIKTIQGELRRNGRLWIKDRVFASKTELFHSGSFALVSAVNLFNEIFWEFSPADKKSLELLAGNAAELFASCAGDGTVLVAEPGIPRSGEFISSLRSSLLELGFNIISPCTHKEACPYPGTPVPGRGKAKWCHFSFSAEDAPLKLQKLSAAAGIPKERAVLSFLFAGKESSTGNNAIRVMSDSFPVTDYSAGHSKNTAGRYCCSSQGAILLVGSKSEMESLGSGDIAETELGGERDPKSKALLGRLVIHSQTKK